jgi:hypothetical protein
MPRLNTIPIAEIRELIGWIGFSEMRARGGVRDGLLPALERVETWLAELEAAARDQARPEPARAEGWSWAQHYGSDVGHDDDDDLAFG